MVVRKTNMAVVYFLRKCKSAARIGGSTVNADEVLCGYKFVFIHFVFSSVSVVCYSS